MSVVRFPVTVEEAAASPGEYRAGGTDVMDRRAQGITPIEDLVDAVHNLAHLMCPGEFLRLGTGAVADFDVNVVELAQAGGVDV